MRNDITSFLCPCVERVISSGAAACWLLDGDHEAQLLCHSHVQAYNVAANTGQMTLLLPDL